MPPITINPIGPKEIRGYSYSSADFSISAAPVITNVGGTSTPAPNEKDRQVESLVNAEVKTEAQINTSLIANSYRSGTLAVATVDEFGFVSWVKDGQARIIADSPKMSKSVLCNISKVGGQNTLNFVDYLPTWLSYKLKHDLDAMIAGTMREINGPAISAWSPLARNPLNWATQAGVDMTPIMTLNSMSGARDQVTLLTPRHAMGCNHNRLSPGTWLQFLAQDGTNRICQRTITGAINITYPLGTASDGQVYVLDSDVDSFIGHAMVLPTYAVFGPRLPSVFLSNIQDESLQYVLPMIVQDRYKMCNIVEWAGDSNYPPVEGWNAYATAPTTGDRAQYAFAPVGGDSGSPRCLIYNNRLIVHSFLSGVVLPELAGQVNAAIVALGNSNGYQVEVANFSSYPSYP